MYNNEEVGFVFEEFFFFIGEKVCLKGFIKYVVQLDVKIDFMGIYFFYMMYQDYEIMFYVFILFFYIFNNRQQLLWKRYIGNDIVMIIFQEFGVLLFIFKNICFYFQYVFIIV